MILISFSVIYFVLYHITEVHSLAHSLLFKERHLFIRLVLLCFFQSANVCLLSNLVFQNATQSEMGGNKTFVKQVFAFDFEVIISAKHFKQCRRNDPVLGKCLQGAVLDAFRKMRTSGIPSLGVLPLEPLVVNDIKIDPGSDGPVTMKLHFTNLKMHGIPDSNFITYNADLNEAKLTTTAVTSKLWFDADYEADGKVLLLPVKGSGKCNVTLTDLTTDAELRFKPETKKGETYWIIQSFKNKFRPKKVTVFFEGLLKGDRRLSTGINKFLNDNWKIVFEELGPSFEDSFGAVFKEITHRVFSRVPINKIFLN